MDKEQFKQFLPYIAHNVRIKILNYTQDYTGIKESYITGVSKAGSYYMFEYRQGNAAKSIDEFIPLLKPLTSILPHMSRFEYTTPEEVRKMAFSGKIRSKDLDWLYENHVDIYNLIETLWTQK